MRYWSGKTELPVARLVGWLGLARSKFYDWQGRYGQANEHNALVPRDCWLEDWERAAIVVYARHHPLEGYRRLAFMMLDELDGFSRYIVHWEIRERMTEQDVEVIVQRAPEKFPDAKPRIISDNGPQFIARDFKEFLRIAGMTHVRISPGYPQSNGKKERFYQTLKTECIRPGTPLSLEEARRLVADFVAHYNAKRLHSAIGYVAPLDKLEGRAEAIWAERDRKLAAAREARAARRAQARLGTEPRELLTTRKETPMIHPAGEPEAGPAGEQPARDTRLGCGRKARAGMAPRGYPCPPLKPFGLSPDASENSDWPQASRPSESLIPEGRLSSSR